MENIVNDSKFDESCTEDDGFLRAYNVGLKTSCIDNMPHNVMQYPVKSCSMSSPISESIQTSEIDEVDEKSPPLSPLFRNIQQKVVATVPNNEVTYNWQATKTTVRERFAFMFHNEILCDIHFLVGKSNPKQKIPAHKFVLSCGSAVFDAMFHGPLKTSAEEIELPDVEPAAFLAFLRYLYSDEVQICPDTVMETLYIAKKYAVPALEKHCVKFLEKNLGSDNAFTLLTQARMFDEPKLAALCLETIDNNTEKALAAEGFLEIDLDTLCAVIERDSLRISEAKLFQAVVWWAEMECTRQHLAPATENLRTVIGKALKLIRFPLMSMEEFATCAAQSGILTDREAVQLFLYFTVNPKPNTGFLNTPRCHKAASEITVSRFNCINSRWGYSGTSDKVRLVVDRKIFIIGFGLYGSTHSLAEYDVLLQIIHLPTGEVCGSNKTGFSSDGSNFIFRVMFKDPVEIQPLTSYIAAVTLKGPDSFYGTKGLQKIALNVPGEENGKVTFEFFAAGINNGTSVDEGQIPEIIFHV